MKFLFLNINKVRLSIFTVSFIIGIFISGNVYNFEFSALEIEHVEPVLQNVKDFGNQKCDHNPLVLVLTSNKKREIFVNQIPLGTLANLSIVKKFLRNIFNEREANGVFYENTHKPIKEVIIISNNFIKDKDLINLVDSLEQLETTTVFIDWDNSLENNPLTGGHGGLFACNYFDRNNIELDK